MLTLKHEIEIGIKSINKTIVEVQKEIDSIFEERLETYSLNDNELKIKTQMLRERKCQAYGWLGALESVLEKIQMKLDQEEADFEEMLETVPTHI